VAGSTGTLLAAGIADVAHTAPFLLGGVSAPGITWALLGVGFVLHVALTPAMALPGAWTDAGRCRRASLGDGVVGIALLGFRVGSMIGIAATVLQQSSSDGCASFDSARAAGAGPFPAGLDLLGDPGALARALSIGIVSAVAAITVALFSIVPAVSMTLQLQSSVAATRAEQTRSNLSKLLRAVTYVSHHARGPLNAAVMCLAVLQHEATEADAEGLSVKASGALMTVRRSEKRPAQRGSTAPPPVPSGPPARALPDPPAPEAAAPPPSPGRRSAAAAGLTAALRVDVTEPALHAETVLGTAPPAALADSARGASTPSSDASTPQAATRDLRIALEAAKQELDDLLLWQRLSSTTTAGQRESWGCFSAPWFDVVATRFAERRHVARVALRVTGGPPAPVPTDLTDVSAPRQDAASHRRPLSEGGATLATAASSATPTPQSAVAGGLSPNPPPSAALGPIRRPTTPVTPGVVELDSGDVSCATTPAASPAPSRSSHQHIRRRSTFFNRLAWTAASPEPEPAHLWLAHVDHARLQQAAVALVAVGTYAAAAGHRSLEPGSPRRGVQLAVHVSRNPGGRSGLPYPAHPRPESAPSAVRGIVAVEVRHTGKGYTPQQLSEDPFEPFAHLAGGDDSLQLSESGLRLAVVSGIAAAMGGEAGIASAGPDDGAHIWLTVPAWVVPKDSEGAAGLCDPADASSVHALSPENWPSGVVGIAGRRLGSTQSDTRPGARAGSRRGKPLAGWVVWVADDDAVIARVTSAVVRRWGAAPRTFADGADLVAALDGGPSSPGGTDLDPDAAEGGSDAGRTDTGSSAEEGRVRTPADLPRALLVDSRMPVLSGVATIGQALAAGRRIDPLWLPRVVMITGEADGDTEARARAVGAHAVLTKPVAARDLLAALLPQG